mgnify:CR=1 FL=1
MKTMTNFDFLKEVDFSSLEIIADGKSKTIYALDDKTAIMFYKPHLRSVTHKREGIINGTDIYRMYATMFFLNLLEEQGIPTQRVNDKILDINGKLAILIKRCKPIPLEWIRRYYAAGSIVRLFPIFVKEGQKLDPPLNKYDAKIDVSLTGGIDDPTMNESYITGLHILTKQQFQEADRMLSKIGDILNEVYQNAGIRLIDLKMEFGLLDEKVILIDELSQDCMRANDMITGETLTKDAYRQWKKKKKVLETYKTFLQRMCPDYENSVLKL